MLSMETQNSQHSSQTWKKVFASVAGTACVAAGVVAVVSTSPEAASSSSLLANKVPAKFGGVYRATWDNGEGFNGKFNKAENVNGDWILEGQVASNDGSVSFTLKDNQVVRQRVGVEGKKMLDCFSQQRWPAYGQMKDSLNHAVEIPASRVSQAAGIKFAENCPEGTEMFGVDFMTQQYGVCAQYSRQQGFIKALGPDFVVHATMDANVEHSIEHPEGSPFCGVMDPKMTFQQRLGGESYERKLVQEDSWLFAKKRALMGPAMVEIPLGSGVGTGTVEMIEQGGDNVKQNSDTLIGFVTGGEYDLGRIGETGHELVEPWRPNNPIFPAPIPMNHITHCYFFHGVGGRGDVANNNDPNNSSSPHGPDSGFTYWGNVEMFTGCASHIFMNVDTQNRGYTSTTLHTEFCSMMTNALAPTTLIAHSMGGLSASAAYEAQTCNQGGARYVIVNTPWKGSKGANDIHTYCGIQGLSQIAATVNGYCKACSFITWPPSWSCNGAKEGYKTLFYEQTGTLAMPAIGGSQLPTSASNIATTLCGTDPQGIVVPTTISWMAAVRQGDFASASTLFWWAIGGVVTNSALVGISIFVNQEKIGGCNYWRNGCDGSAASLAIPDVAYNDGMVDVTSCTGTDRHANYASPHYSNGQDESGELNPNTEFMAISHADGTCMNGDSLYGNVRPCTWIANKVSAIYHG